VESVIYVILPPRRMESQRNRITTSASRCVRYGFHVSATVKVDENGVLHLAAPLLPVATPHLLYRVERSGQSVVLSLEPGQEPEAATSFAQAQAWAADFLKWADTHTDGPGLPEHAVSRDGIYE
jgi:hypothetical protein